MEPLSRVQSAMLRHKVMSAAEAAAFIRDGDNVGMSGFTGAGYPKAVPLELARRMELAHRQGQSFRVGVWTGASTAPELDGVLAQAGGVARRLPYQSDPACRTRINAGHMDYVDIHLSQVAQSVRGGCLGRLDVALVEVTAVLEDGRLVPSSSVGNNQTWLDLADRVILEVNHWQPAELEGMHDIGEEILSPPFRRPIPIVSAGDRIGSPCLRVAPEKVVAIVETCAPDRNPAFRAADQCSEKIAGHLLEFLLHEVHAGRLPADLLPLQSGVGNIANAVLAGINDGPFKNLTAYTEVLQDSMLAMLRSGKMTMASATALSLSPSALQEFLEHIGFYRERIVLRPEEISNHPEVIRRLGVIAMNGMIEADIYGNVNSTHIMGTRMMNGIGGSGDFARNAGLSVFMTPSTAKDGAISCIVPMVSHVDHTEHDVQVIVTEQGLADLRGLAPRQRAQRIIDHCAHPDFRPALRDYLARAERAARHGMGGLHTPHVLDEALSWHARYERTGSMKDLSLAERTSRSLVEVP